MIHPTAKLSEQVHRKCTQEHDFTTSDPLNKPYPLKLHTRKILEVLLTSYTVLCWSRECLHRRKLRKPLHDGRILLSWWWLASYDCAVWTVLTAPFRNICTYDWQLCFSFTSESIILANKASTCTWSNCLMSFIALSTHYQNSRA